MSTTESGPQSPACICENKYTRCIMHVLITNSSTSSQTFSQQMNINSADIATKKTSQRHI